MQLADMGFPRDAVVRAQNATGNTQLTDLESNAGAQVIAWLIEHNHEVFLEGMSVYMYASPEVLAWLLRHNQEMFGSTCDSVAVCMYDTPE